MGRLLRIDRAIPRQRVRDLAKGGLDCLLILRHRQIALRLAIVQIAARRAAEDGLADGLTDQAKASPGKSEERAELANLIANVRLILENIAARAAPIRHWRP